MSMLSRIYHDVKNSFSDAYGHFMLGDDAGKGATFACIFRPRKIVDDSNNNSMGSSKFDLGMTFCEVNERAYVRTVDPESDAALAGVKPRDCVQLALVLAGGKLEALQEDDRKAVSHALECERGGSRTSYDEMRVLFERCTVLPRSNSANSLDRLSGLYDSIFESPSSASSEGARRTGSISNNVKSTTQRILSRYAPGQVTEQTDGGWMPSSLDDEALYPVVLVFRRTRKRIAGLSPINIPTFRMDDECERAANLIRRLAPTVDSEFQPDAWDEIMENTKEYFNPNTSREMTNNHTNPSRFDHINTSKKATSSSHSAVNEAYDDENIPLDSIEEQTVELIESLKIKMKADVDSQRREGEDDVEAETIRGMVQQALGLAFIRTSKFVLGVSVHAGTGIVIARLPDGTWSAPSAIGACGLGLGIQFGLETVDYIFVIQKQEALDHFLRGGNFTVGGNVGAAFAGLGREAYGAASLRDTICLSSADRLEIESATVENSTEVATIVAYAKAQGLYIGMSVEGQKFFTRDDVNDRIYKFMAGRSVTAREILTGATPTPPEAEDLYAALHSVEFTHEIMRLPRPPRILRDDVKYEWRCDRPTLAINRLTENDDTLDKFAFFDNLGKDDAQEFSTFETKFKSFLYGGVSVQRILPISGAMKSRRERRTLWLMLPEVGSLQLGLVAKTSDDPHDGVSMSQRVTGIDDQSEYSNSLRGQQDSDDIMRFDGDDTTVGDGENVTVGGTRRMLKKVRLSSDNSMPLTDITVMKLNPTGSTIPKLEDDSEHFKLIYIEEITRTKSLLLLTNTVAEAEILLCGLKLLIERETARFGVRGGQPMSAFGVFSTQKATSSNFINEEQPNAKVQAKRSLVTEEEPSQSTFRGSSSTFEAPNVNLRFEYGVSIVQPLDEFISLPIPLPLCRALLLDSSSPVIRKWDQDRGDTDYVKSNWESSKSAANVTDSHPSELKHITSGTMVGAARTITFKRMRNGQKVSLSETHTIDIDDPSELSFSVNETLPRRGFAVSVKLKISATSHQSCEILITADLMPIGRNMSDQEAVHKAYLLVVDELKARYGSGDKGLIRGLQLVTQSPHHQRPYGHLENTSRLSASDEQRQLPRQKVQEITSAKLPLAPTIVSEKIQSTKNESERKLKQQAHVPPVYEPQIRREYRENSSENRDHRENSSEIFNSTDESNTRATVVVPQLPRIPLALMPCPREEDESKIDDDGSLHQSRNVSTRRNGRV